MPKLDGVKDVKQALRKLYTKAQGWKKTVVVGYTQAYALWVHELDKNYNAGQWKYLETAARDNKEELVRVMHRAVRAGNLPQEALLKAGLRLQRESQELCPEDTTALKASAFTALEENVDAAAAEALSKSDAKKKKVKAKRHERSLKKRSKAKAKRAKAKAGRAKKK